MLDVFISFFSFLQKEVRFLCLWFRENFTSRPPSPNVLCTDICTYQKWIKSDLLITKRNWHFLLLKCIWELFFFSPVVVAVQFGGNCWCLEFRLGFDNITILLLFLLLLLFFFFLFRISIQFCFEVGTTTRLADE